MDRNSLFDCLVAWVNTFNLGKQCQNVDDFKDGLVIANCLNNIDPDYFNDEWLTKIKQDTNENWRLKLLNLKKVLQTLTDYYSEVLNHSLNGFEMPNLNVIVESSTADKAQTAREELSHLLQLVLGCAVNCQRRSEFIKNIMEMNESTQHMIMNAIQDLMSKDRNMNNIKSSVSFGINNSEDDIAYQLKKTIQDMNRLSEQKEEIEQNCKRLDKQVSELQEEKLALISEMKMLKAKLQREDNSLADPNNDLNKQLKLQQKLDSMQEELYRLESEKEKYKIQFEAAKAEQDGLIEKNVELKKMAQEHQHLKDEIDILKHTSDKVEKLESAIESYKIKLEEMSDLKKQMKMLEENNTKYLEKILVMEDEVKKITTLKSQIEMYKKQIQELHEQILNNEMQMKKLEYEYKSVQEKCMDLGNDRDRLQLEYDRLKESYETMSINAHAIENTKQNLTYEETTNQVMDGLFSSFELVNIPSDTKEKIIRLFHENKLFKAKQSDLNDERLILLQTQYEDEKQRSLDLQAKLNETTKQKIELECQLNDLKKKDSENNNYINTIEQEQSQSSTKDELLNELRVKLLKAERELEEEVKKNESKLKKLELKLQVLHEEKDELKEQKDKELQAAEKRIVEQDEKYRAYLEKAKVVIKSLDPRNSTSSNNEVQILKAQLAEKDKVIKQLTKDYEKIRNSREQEEQLIASAWYHLGANLNRRSTDERISTIGNSFLSQQRHLPSSSSTSSLNSSKRNSSSFKLNLHSPSQISNTSQNNSTPQTTTTPS